MATRGSDTELSAFIPFLGGGKGRPGKAWTRSRREEYGWGLGNGVAVGPWEFWPLLLLLLLVN